MLKTCLLFISALLFSSTVLAADFQAGKDYQIVQGANNPISDVNKSVVSSPRTGQITVIEFFSYGCPACFHFESSLQKWLKNKPSTVAFQRIPVVFSPNWQSLAKAYYTARQLGVADKLTPAIFDAVQQQGIDLDDPKAMEELFVKNGVPAQQFRNAFEFSPMMSAELNQSAAMMRVYKVYQIPTLIVSNGRQNFSVNPSLSGGDYKKMLEVINFLVEKAGGPKIVMPPENPLQEAEKTTP